MKFAAFGLIALILSAYTSLHAAPTPESKTSPASTTMIDVYTSGKDGYYMYRIPSIVTAPDGSLLAFAEGRKKSKSDSGDIDMLVKRSTDGGYTWSKQQIIWDDGPNTCGNPCPVVDQTTGTIHLLMTHNPGNYKESKPEAPGVGTRTVWVTTSNDSGLTWSQPREITSDVKDSSWLWFATGPGIGIQIKNGPHAGRLLIPANYSRPEAINPSEKWPGRAIGTYAFYSDDHGKTWQSSANTIEPHVNESQLVELPGGNVMTNMRAYFKDSRRRSAISKDSGTTWSKPRKEDALIEPVCQASILRYSWPSQTEQSILLFANPAHKTKRRHLTFRASFDEGKTWPVSKMIYKGDTAYSSLIRLPGNNVGCFFERDGYKTMTLIIVPITELTQSP
ncbi:sialidase family protein [Poriferisphaera sp. WC338]|uniref:sialidase family protein n=1 Tax=Poriferisphaera sp. WC338 TaxID=3425129 RepID=UPI003D818E92